MAAVGHVLSVPLVRRTAGFGASCLRGTFRRGRLTVPLRTLPTGVGGGSPCPISDLGGHLEYRSGRDEPVVCLRADGRGFDREPAGAPSKKQFEIDDLGCVAGIGFGPHSGKAFAQAPPYRSECLPFQAIQRIPGRVRLRDRRAGKTLSPILVMARRAGQVQLTLAALEDRPPGFDKLPGPRLVGDLRSSGPSIDARQTRSAPAGRGFHTAASSARWYCVRQALMRCSRSIGRRARRIIGRIAGGDAAHAGPGIAVAIGAGFAVRAFRPAATAPRRRAPRACLDWRRRHPASRGSRGS